MDVFGISRRRTAPPVAQRAWVLGECFRPVMIFFSTPRRSASSVAGGDHLQI
jgi:hypothetical protein